MSPEKSRRPIEGRVAQRIDAAAISAAIAPLRARWSSWAERAATTPGGMRGIEAKARRLGVERSVMYVTAGGAVAEAASALAKLRDEAHENDERGAVFILIGAERSAAIAAVAASSLANTGRRVVVALCSARLRPEDRDAAALWDRLASHKHAERYRIPDTREAAHFRAGLESVAVVIEALGGATLPARGPIAAGVDLVRRARGFGVPCLAIGGPIGLDGESGARRRGAPGADVSIVFHRPLTGHRSVAARRLTGEILVAPFGIPAGADSASS
jgi:NAD(P)H-hydrate repair Nnr-like enzyme with NAD(P)H-hydrate epimerase domain